MTNLSEFVRLAVTVNPVVNVFSEFLPQQKRAYARPTSTFGFPMVDIKNTSDTYLKNALEYILRNDKTQNGELIDSYYCTPEYAEIQFEQVRSKEVIKKGNNIAWHLFQSFSPDDDITPEQALEIGKELMRRYYPNYQYVIATHTDKDHIHNHIILNSVDFKTFHKLNFNKDILAQIQAVSNGICIENNLSVIDKDGTLFQRRDLRKLAFLKIDRCFNEITEKANPQKEISAEESSQANNKTESYSKIILNNLEKIKTGVKNTFIGYVKFKANEIFEKTNILPDKFAESICDNTDYAFKKFEEKEQKRKNPVKPEILKKNLKELIFTAVEKTYNNIPKSFTHKHRLKAAIDKAVQQAADFDDFLRLMQESSYEIESGSDRKGLAFKDENMARFMYSKSIALDYSESMLKYRIKNRKEPPSNIKNRTLYDEKIKSRNKRKSLQSEIDSSIRKTSSYEEFIADMRRKNFEIKEGKHLAFRDLDLKKEGKELRFLRAKSLGIHYTEEAIKYRLTHKEQYKKITENQIEKVMTVKYSEDVNLISWKRGKNGQLTTDSRNWIVDNLFGDYGYDCRDFYNGRLNLANIEIYGLFLEKYESRTVSMASMENKIEDNEKTMHDIQKHIKAINGYWKLKPQLEKLGTVDPDNLSGQELTEYRSFRSKWQYAYKMFESSREKYGTLSTKKLKSRQDELKAEQEQLQKKLIELKLASETWDNIKYNYESKDGWDYTLDKVELAKSLWANRKAEDEIKRQKEAEKAKFKEVQAKNIKRHIRDWTL